MKYDELMRSVASATGLTKAAADEAVLATLTTLAEHISADETRDLLAQLPKSLKARVPIPAQPSPVDVGEFLDGVAARLDNIEVSQAEAQVRAVFSVLGEAVNSGEMRDIAEELGVEFADLLGRPVPTTTPSGFDPGSVTRWAFRAVTAVPRATIALAAAGIETGRRTTRDLTNRVSRLVARAG